MSELRHASGKVGVITYIEGWPNASSSQLDVVRSLLPDAHVIPGKFSTDPQFSGLEYDAWTKGAKPARPAYLRTA